MAKDPPSSRTGRHWATGGNAPFREDLVAWPNEHATSIETMTVEDLRAELVRSRDEIRRLHSRIATLVEENEALRPK